MAKLLGGELGWWGLLRGDSPLPGESSGILLPDPCLWCGCRDRQVEISFPSPAPCDNIINHRGLLHPAYEGVPTNPNPQQPHKQQGCAAGGCSRLQSPSLQGWADPCLHPGHIPAAPGSCPGITWAVPSAGDVFHESLAINTPKITHIWLPPVCPHGTLAESAPGSDPRWDEQHLGRFDQCLIQLLEWLGDPLAPSAVSLFESSAGGT